MHIFLMIAAGVVSFIGLVTLSEDVEVNGETYTIEIHRREIIAIGTFCFLGEFLDI